MPPPTPPPECVGFGHGVPIDGDPEHAGSDGAPVRLSLRDPSPATTLAFAKVHAVFTISGTLEAYVAADYSTNYPSTPQQISVTVRIAGCMGC